MMHLSLKMDFTSSVPHLMAQLRYNGTNYMTIIHVSAASVSLRSWESAGIWKLVTFISCAYFRFGIQNPATASTLSNLCPGHQKSPSTMWFLYPKIQSTLWSATTPTRQSSWTCTVRWESAIFIIFTYSSYSLLKVYSHAGAYICSQGPMFPSSIFC